MFFLFCLKCFNFVMMFICFLKFLHKNTTNESDLVRFNLSFILNPFKLFNNDIYTSYFCPTIVLKLQHLLKECIFMYKM